MSKIAFPATHWSHCGNTSFYRKERHDAAADIFIDPVDAIKVEVEDHGNYYLVTKKTLVDLDVDRIEALKDDFPLEVEVAAGWVNGLETITESGANRRDILRGLDHGNRMWRSGVLEAMETVLIGMAAPRELVYDEKLVSHDESEVSAALMEFGVFEC